MEVNGRISAGVTIVGAGPAGSTLAALLADAGVDVVIVDKAAFPRDKVCGEFLSYDAMPLLDRLDLTRHLDDAGATRISRCRIIGSARTYEFELPHPARGVSRLLLDDLLLKRAAELGARALTGCEVTAMKPGRDSAQVTLRSESGEFVIDSRIVVGAWGRWGRFDQQLGRKFTRDRRHRHFGFKRHYRPFNGIHQETIDLHAFREGYLGVSGVEGGLTNICGLVHHSRITKLKGGWESFIRTLRTERASLDSLFEAHEPAQPDFLSSEPVIFRARSPVERGVFMAGDAAGIIDPLTGNGMAMAIQGALITAPAILERLRTREHASIVERQYRTAFSRMFAARLWWSRRVAFLLSRPDLLEASMRLTSSPAPGKFLLEQTRASYEQIRGLVEAWDARRSRQNTVDRRQ